MILCRSVTSLGLAVLLALPQIAAGQDFCRTALNSRPFPTLRNATLSVQSTDLWPVLWKATLSRAVRLDSVARGLIPQSGDYTFNEWYFDPGPLTDSLRLKVARDSASRWGVAFQLADLFRGGEGGAATGMAYAAASLYSAWRLPPEPAAAFLADPAFSLAARNKAVRALEPYWSTQAFRRAAAAALCTLAARVAGAVTMRGDSAPSEREVLDAEESQFFSDIVWALGSAAEAGGPSPRGVIDLLPPRNPVTAWLKKSVE